MDSITLILVALKTGAITKSITDIGSEYIQDAYEHLKTLIKEKYTVTDIDEISEVVSYKLLNL